MDKNPMISGIDSREEVREENRPSYEQRGSNLSCHPSSAQFTGKIKSKTSEEHSNVVQHPYTGGRTVPAVRVVQPPMGHRYSPEASKVSMHQLHNLQEKEKSNTAEDPKVVNGLHTGDQTVLAVKEVQSAGEAPPPVDHFETIVLAERLKHVKPTTEEIDKYFRGIPSFSMYSGSSYDWY